MVEVFRANQANFAVKSFEGHQGVSLQGQWAAETMAFRAGSLFVPINQSRARLLMSLLEPQAPDSLAAWGYFNQAFEVKEDMEAYVAEEVAREQLQRDPALAVQFAQKLANEPGFAKDPSARLEFFARRHASWDNFYNLYPVYRTAVLPK